eukprot:TRINITY_DN23721_c0_g1_i1.p1 TRINITY_DN23721_c0_g1~~TRINITY_DN23721_c0_g1_i1.p1  ORF type:complete len:293 (+),score=56.36 TRINITY_DN23721_c0_g1_i1:28-879(+)
MAAAAKQALFGDVKPGQIKLGSADPTSPGSRWAQECWQAADEALEADWKARVAARSAHSHRMAAQIAALTARSAARKLRRLGAAAVYNDVPELGPGRQFCRQLAMYVERNPGIQQAKSWPRIQQMRGFCGGLEAFADVAARAGSLKGALDHLRPFARTGQAPSEFPARTRLPKPPAYFGATPVDLDVMVPLLPLPPLPLNRRRRRGSEQRNTGRRFRCLRRRCGRLVLGAASVNIAVDSGSVEGFRVAAPEAIAAPAGARGACGVRAGAGLLGVGRDVLRDFL